jgi:hypothetical protein
MREGLLGLPLATGSWLLSQPEDSGGILGASRPGLDPMAGSSVGAMGPSLGGRASRGLARFLIIFSIGIGATLAWQSYGDAARAMLANSSPQLGWLAPQTAPLAQTTPSMVVPPTADTASSDLQQLTAASPPCARAWISSQPNLRLASNK